MNHHGILLFAIALGACSHSSTSTATSPVPEKGKPTAPVSITAAVSGRVARITVTFEADASDVTVGVHGNDGLVVEGNLSPVQGQKFARGERTSFSVSLAPPGGRSSLVISVVGRFNGEKRARTASFGVGEGPMPASPGEVMTTDQGDTVKVLPAGQ
jgi:hypothetical protein